MTETSHRTSVSVSGGDDSVYASRVSAMFSALDNRDSDTVIGHLTGDVVVHLGTTSKIFTAPTDRRTQDYITGRFG